MLSIDFDVGDVILEDGGYIDLYISIVSKCCCYIGGVVP